MRLLSKKDARANRGCPTCVRSGRSGMRSVCCRTDVRLADDDLRFAGDNLLRSNACPCARFVLTGRTPVS